MFSRKSVSFFNECEIKSNINKQLSICKIIKYYKSLSSTQTTVKRLARKGFKEGTVVIAEQQTNSYGRIKRKWDSRSGGLWFSVLLRPLMRLEEVSRISLLLSIALSITLEKNYKVDSEIKWPNDVLVFGKKIAGIIIEISAEQDLVNWVAVGIGINISNDLPKNLEDTAIALKTILKRGINKTEFFAALLINFENLYLDFQKNGFKQFFKIYNSKIAYKNRYVNVNSGYNSIIGVNLGVDEKGKLIVKTHDGFEHIVSGTLRINNEKN
ncbi:MAG: biotin--[acetyl-CoA-carboxylase] ligase [Endomicrobium sp.]|jgi:BirA family biotin operon repressor/biotin-[acetyl-CoA-carboxylase] ligase|nr:biotin--[acetyl-CoA-carboxylase] ligase [Endomicrobium sp.]